MAAMRKLGLLLLVCAACGAKKPAAKSPAPPPAPEAQPDDKQPGDATKSTNTPRTAPGDPCDGGEKPH
jgi:hypothetical protein